MNTLSRLHISLLSDTYILYIVFSLWNSLTLEYPYLNQHGFWVEGNTVLKSFGFAVKQIWVLFPHLTSFYLLCVPQFAHLVLLSIK